MKKLFIILIFSNVLFAFDFTSFLNKSISPVNSKDSPGALNNMYKAHSWIHDTHQKEIKDLNNIKSLSQEIYIENKNLIFETKKFKELLFNYLKVKYTKD